MACLKVNTFLRPLSTARLSYTRSAPLAVRQHRYYAGQSYGGGQGDPKGETPQEQGANPSAELEHPGPPPPDVGKGTGGGPTKAGSDGHNTQDGPSQGGSGQSGASQSSRGPQPKIHSENIPAEESDDVKAHNEDMTKRHDRATAEVDKKGETVEKGFWKVGRFLPMALFAARWI
ncbi:MAG: hypothetical protein L6R40_007189 [Gallowayella cf. fulva]|nr:MAG: hypothetical protein L6R40_007189 [Xanthomendoza cf. fulva]